MFRSLLLVVLSIALTGSSLMDSKATNFGKARSVPRPLRLSNFKAVPMPRPLLKSRGQGGENGSVFDDMYLSDSIIGVHSINISSGDQVNSIEVMYVLSNKSLLRAPRHGKPSESSVNITLTPDEEIVKIEGKTNGQLVDQLTITTVGPNYEHKVYGPFGRTGTLSFEFDGQLIAFYGHSGDLLDNVGVYYLDTMKMSDRFGENPNNDFDDYYESKYPPIVSIRSINIWSTPSTVVAFQVEYILVDGSLLLGGRHGSLPSANLTTVIFQDETLISLEGKVYKTLEDRIGELTFITLKENGEPGKYGPFGALGTEPFNIPGNIVGFFGNSGTYINSIGVYYV